MGGADNKRDYWEDRAIFTTGGSEMAVLTGLQPFLLAADRSGRLQW